MDTELAFDLTVGARKKDVGTRGIAFRFGRDEGRDLADEHVVRDQERLLDVAAAAVEDQEIRVRRCMQGTPEIEGGSVGNGSREVDGIGTLEVDRERTESARLCPGDVGKTQNRKRCRNRGEEPQTHAFDFHVEQNSLGVF